MDTPVVEFENGGAERTEMYGKELIKRLSVKLSSKLGKGFSQRSLEQFRNFYMHYNEIAQTPSAQSIGALQKIQQTLSAQSFPGRIGVRNSRKIFPVLCKEKERLNPIMRFLPDPVAPESAGALCSRAWLDSPVRRGPEQGRRS